MRLDVSHAEIVLSLQGKEGQCERGSAPRWWRR